MCVNDRGAVMRPLFYAPFAPKRVWDSYPFPNLQKYPDER